MKKTSGLKLLDEREGSGTPAKKGDEVLLNEKQAEHLPKEMVHVEDGVMLIDHTIVLGCREAIVGVEYALMGMKVSGYRKVRISSHLAYRDMGVPEMRYWSSRSGCERSLKSVKSLRHEHTDSRSLPLQPKLCFDSSPG